MKPVPIISIIAAIGQNREIGYNNKLPWHISADLKHFKKITYGHPIIMGRKNFESIGKPLPGRKNYVITRQFDLFVPNIIICHSLEEAICHAKNTETKEIFIIGGGQIFKQGITIVDKLYLTQIFSKFTADSYFPDFSDFLILTKSDIMESDSFHYQYLELIRKS